MAWLRRALCKAIGCRVKRCQRSIGLLVCRDCSASFRVPNR